ncbi:fimbrial protein [Salmonella enterica]|nr:fimbrial protein [Salmonella enterica]
MNNVMHGKIRRSDGGNTLCRLFRSGLWFSCLALLCFAVLPEFAGAEETTPVSSKCTDWDGQGGRPVKLELPPAVSFETGNVPANGTVLYTSPGWNDIRYQCSKSKEHAGLFKGGPALYLLASGNALLKQALNNAGLKLLILVNSEGKAWSPLESDHIVVGSYNNENKTGQTTLKLKAQLVVADNSKITPGFYAVPDLSAFKLVPFEGAINFTGVPINTGAVRLQFVPKCFVKTSLSTPDINFGPVITTDVNNSFSRSIPFNVTADVNKSCNNGTFGNLLGAYTVTVSAGKTEDYYLNLPLKVSFMLNNGGEIAPGGKSILLYTNKDDKKQKNGLQLKINAPDGTPVTFNDASSPVNKFGSFQGGPNGGTWNISNTYNAVLSSTGEQVITGKYRAQVTVKVDYY